MLIREVLLFMGLEVGVEPLLDSAAARGMCRREGVGTTRLLSKKVHWVQIRRQRRGLGDEVTTRPQIATAEAMERLGVGPK